MLLPLCQRNRRGGYSIPRIHYRFGGMQDKIKMNVGYDMGKTILAGKGFAHFDRQDARYFQD